MNISKTLHANFDPLSREDGESKRMRFEIHTHPSRKWFQPTWWTNRKHLDTKLTKDFRRTQSEQSVEWVSKSEKVRMNLSGSQHEGCSQHLQCLDSVKSPTVKNRFNQRLNISKTLHANCDPLSREDGESERIQFEVHTHPSTKWRQPTWWTNRKHLDTRLPRNSEQAEQSVEWVNKSEKLRMNLSGS